jgi:hypothetical protein
MFAKSKPPFSWKWQRQPGCNCAGCALSEKIMVFLVNFAKTQSISGKTCPFPKSADFLNLIKAIDNLSAEYYTVE